MAFNPDCFTDQNQWCTDECIQFILSKHYISEDYFNDMMCTPPKKLGTKSFEDIETIVNGKKCTDSITINLDGNIILEPTNMTQYSTPLFKGMLERDVSEFEFYEVSANYVNNRQRGKAVVKLILNNGGAEFYDLSHAIP